MTRWVLLLLSVACAFMAYDTLRWRGAISKTPFKVISGLWNGNQSNLSLVEQSKIRDRFASAMFAGKVVWLLLGCTVLLGVLTVRAFLE
jgi:hypothetical protein